MAVLFALGVMSVLWMAIVAAVIFVEKVLPNGVRISRFVGSGAGRAGPLGRRSRRRACQV